jgi:hypothetical protein
MRDTNRQPLFIYAFWTLFLLCNCQRVSAKLFLQTNWGWLLVSCIVFFPSLILCFGVLGNCTKYCSQAGPTFHLFSEEPANLRRWQKWFTLHLSRVELANPGVRSVPSIKELIFPHCNFHGSESSHISGTIYLVNLSVGWFFFFFFFFP